MQACANTRVSRSSASATLPNVEFTSVVVEIVVLGRNDDASHKAIDKAAPSLAEKSVKVRVALTAPGLRRASTTLSIEQGRRRAGRSSHCEDDHRGGSQNGGQNAEEYQNQRENGKELPGELSCQACGRAMRVVLRLAGAKPTAFPLAHGEEPRRIMGPTTSRSRGFCSWLRLRFTPSAAARRPAKGCRARSRPSKQKRTMTVPGTRSSCAQRTWAIASPSICASDDWRADRDPDSDGWRLINDVPVHFRREAGMQPLPAPSMIDPKKGIARLKEVLCLRDEARFSSSSSPGSLRARGSAAVHGPCLSRRAGLHERRPHL